MTIEITMEHAVDVFHDDQWPLFDREKALAMVDSIPNLGVLSFVATERSLPRDMGFLDETCANSAKQFLFENFLLRNAKAWLFAANDFWAPKSAVSAYKASRNKVWKILSSKWLIDDLHTFEELLFESHEGLRYAGLAEVNMQNFKSATRIVRSYPSSAIVVSNRKNFERDQQVRSLFYASFPEHKGVPQKPVDWMTLALNMCPLGDIIIRVSSSYDEKYVAIDCMMLSEKLAGIPLSN